MAYTKLPEHPMNLLATYFGRASATELTRVNKHRERFNCLVYAVNLVNRLVSLGMVSLRCINSYLIVDRPSQ